MNKYPITTLFMLSSVDGKISSGDSDTVDVDQDWKTIAGVKEGLQQYYDLEQKTDLVSFNTGRVMAKVGVNNKEPVDNSIPVSFVLVDNKPHLTKKGILHLASWLRHLYIVTTNKEHPIYTLKELVNNVTIIEYQDVIDFTNLFASLKSKFNIDQMTIQSGGTMNSVLVRLGLINKISFVLAPLLVGGSTTPTLIDGEAIHSIQELYKLKPLKLIEAKKLENSYIHLLYEVIS